MKLTALRVATSLGAARCTTANFASKRYARMEANDREIILEGAYELGSGYAARYFSLRTCPLMPCLVLYPDQHLFTGHRNLDLALKSIGR
jgi:hypothetical protein